jgi:hypothetical protein
MVLVTVNNRIPMILLIINDVAKHHLQVIFILDRLLLELANTRNFLKKVRRLQTRFFLKFQINSMCM